MSTTHSSSPADRVYQAWWQDGSIDLFAGLTLTGIGIAWLLDGVVFGAILPALSVPLWQSFRRRLVEPRLGRVRFEASRRASLRRAHWTLIAVGCAALATAVSLWLVLRDPATQTDPLATLTPALPAALVGLAAICSAVMFRQPRLALYAVPLLLAGGAVVAFDLQPGWALLAGGLLTTAAGATLFARFRRDFPILESGLD